jgi:hypothetical protein
MREVEKIEE